jgi:hypothetical protein
VPASPQADDPPVGETEAEAFYAAQEAAAKASRAYQARRQKTTT